MAADEQSLALFPLLVLGDTALQVQIRDNGVLSRREFLVLAAEDGEEGYQVDGVFISTTQVNEFAVANRDRFLEITRAARRARRARDGTVTLIEK